MALCVDATYGSFLDCWLHWAIWLSPNQFEVLKEYLYEGCALCSFVPALFINCFAACLFHALNVSICLLLSMENHSILSKRSLWHVPVMFPTLLIQCMFCFAKIWGYETGSKVMSRAHAFYTQTRLASESTRVCIRRVGNSQLPRLSIDDKTYVLNKFFH